MMPSLACCTARLTLSIALLAPLAGLSADKKLPPLPASRQPAFRPAYPPSQAIVDVTFDDTTARSEAPGSDIWPMTWADDGHLYTAWGDGGGFGGTNQDGRVSFGVARVEGGKRDYRGINLAGGKNAPNPMPFAGKSEGILALGRTFYLWRDGEGGSFGYLLTTITHNRDGWMSIYDAPEPWGPWTHVHTEFNPDRWGAYTIIFTFVNKWLSADGCEFVIVHTKDDRWATIEGRFKLARD